MFKNTLIDGYKIKYFIILLQYYKIMIIIVPVKPYKINYYLNINLNLEVYDMLK